MKSFYVVSGKGVIRFRRIDSDEVIEYFVSGDKLEVVDIPTGYTLTTLKILVIQTWSPLCGQMNPLIQTNQIRTFWRFRQMNKMKVMTIVGTRPEITRLSEVIKACDRYFDHVLVHTGQNWDYTLNEIFFEELELESLITTSVLLVTICVRLWEISSLNHMKCWLKKSQMLFFILGDTNSALSAISAKRLSNCLFSIWEAGIVALIRMFLKRSIAGL